MIKEIKSNDLAQALDLVNNVFSEFVAIEYSEEGKNTFNDYLKHKDEEMAQGLKTGHKKMWGYYQDNKIVGVISIRDVSHISLLFVDKKYHRKGIAKQLFNVLLEDTIKQSKTDKITVNSSPYAVEVYEHLGFEKTGEKQEKDGIIFVPMMRLI